MKDTMPPVIEHTADVELSTVIVTGRFWVEDAVGVYVGPSKVAALGAVVVKLSV
jgi:hypothetical protein